MGLIAANPVKGVYGPFLIPFHRSGNRSTLLLSPSVDENHDHNAKDECTEWVDHCQTIMLAGDETGEEDRAGDAAFRVAGFVVKGGDAIEADVGEDGDGGA